MVEDYTVIDLEMTGLSAKCDRVLEAGAVRVRDGAVSETYSAMIYTALPLPEKITKLTGITQEMAASGRDCDEVMRELIAFLGNDVIVGHNVVFDFSFIKQWAQNHDRKFDCVAVDTLKLAQKFLSKSQKKNLGALCVYFHIPRRNAHRALDDALETQLLFEKMKKLYAQSEKTVTAFTPQPLLYKAKRQQPATERQKEYLTRYAHCFGLPLPKNLSAMTRSEASRQLDYWIGNFGKMPK